MQLIPCPQQNQSSLDKVDQKKRTFACHWGGKNVGDPLHFPVPLPLALMDVFFSGAVPYLCMDEFGGYATSLEVWLTPVNIVITGN